MAFSIESRGPVSVWITASPCDPRSGPSDDPGFNDPFRVDAGLPSVRSGPSCCGRRPFNVRTGWV